MAPPLAVMPRRVCGGAADLIYTVFMMSFTTLLPSIGRGTCSRSTHYHWSTEHHVRQPSEHHHGGVSQHCTIQHLLALMVAYLVGWLALRAAL